MLLRVGYGEPCGRGVEKLNEVEHRGLLVTELHEDAAELLDFETESFSDVAALEHEIVYLLEAERLIEGDRPLHVADADVHVKHFVEHRSSPRLRAVAPSPS